MNNNNVMNNTPAPVNNNAPINNNALNNRVVKKPVKKDSMIPSYMVPSMNNVKGLALDTFDQSLFSINMGFTLAAVLAWHEAIKSFVQSKLPAKTAQNSQLFIALGLTIAAAVIFRLIKKVRPNTKRSVILPVAM